MTFNPDQALQLARETLDIEAEALIGLKSRLDSRFSHAVHMMLNVQGRVGVTGMGKSGHIGSKSQPPGVHWPHPPCCPSWRSQSWRSGHDQSVDVVSPSPTAARADELVSSCLSKTFGRAAHCHDRRHEFALAQHADVVLDSSAEQRSLPTQFGTHGQYHGSIGFWAMLWPLPCPMRAALKQKTLHARILAAHWAGAY